MDAELYKIWEKFKELEERVSEIEDIIGSINPAPTLLEHAPNCPRAQAWDVSEASCTCNYGDYDEEQILYAIGLSSDGEAFGMTYGPTPNLESILSITDADEGRGTNAYIIKFQGEKSQPIYLWDHEDEKWIPLAD